MEDGGSGNYNSTATSFAKCTHGSADLGVLFIILVQTTILLILSHVFHFFLKRLSQPSAISQMLAGVALGPSGLANLPVWRGGLFNPKDNDYLSSFGTAGRMFFMLLVGLEMDIPFLFRTSRRTAIVAYGGAFSCAVVAAIFSPLVYWLFEAQSNRFFFALTLMLVFSNTASPILVRMTTELKLATSEVGRLSISAALVNDMTCLVIVALVTTSPTDEMSGSETLFLGFVALALMAGSACLIRPVVRWLNRRNQERKYIKNVEIIGILIYIVGVSSATEIMGYSSMMACFVMGLLFPREGSTARTLVDKLTFPVYHIILPIYFGYTGLQTNLLIMRHGRLYASVITVVVLSTVGKVVGTVVATQYLGISIHVGLALGFLLNVKGHIDLIIILLARRHEILDSEGYMMLLITMILNTLTAGPAVAAVVRSERKALKYRAMGLEWQNPDSELRVLACVHNPREVPTILNLVEVSSGSDKMPIAIYIMHLIELNQRVTTSMFYHQQEDHKGEGWEVGGDKARQVNAAADAFMEETGITIRQVSAVSNFNNMHEDVCNAATDVRASVVIVPFHKHQRIDGKMRSSGKDGIRTVNLKVLRHAPCTVGILVDRGMGGTTQASAAQASHHVAVLFFGGGDDREALAFGGRLAMHPWVSLTLVRFLPVSTENYNAGIEMQASKDDEVLMVITNHEKERGVDEEFLSNFHSRFVAAGMVTYVEKMVENGPETVTAISSMEGMYSLFVVGKGRDGLSPLTMGLSDWEECSELGPIGDLLASSDFMSNGSVLVLQQHDRSKKEESAADDDFMVL